MNKLLTKEEQILLMRSKGFSGQEIADALYYNITDVTNIISQNQKRAENAAK